MRWNAYGSLFKEVEPQMKTLISQRKRQAMQLSNVLPILILLGAVAIPAQGVAIEERNVFNFMAVVNCANPHFSNMRYIDYGCFCGFGGSGNPVDAIDRCCYLHDQCYGEAEKMGCYIWITTYFSRCNDEVPTCYNGGLPWKTCSDKMCECDIAIAKCFRKHSNVFNQTFEDYDQDLCHSTPSSTPRMG
ncbi:basic phospholipase A2-like [Heptranchias perlo]|uniref:basic phospholipase A2-like n=1 Tax=Heptranchias perlo TaxID=212740 RepID=UPI00355A2390